MAISRIHPLFLLLLLRAFALLPTQASARGGHDLSDYGDNGPVSRNLLQDKPHITEEMARGYMSNAELEIAVHAFGSRRSNISRIYSIGKSVNDFPLWVIEISDKPRQREAEPAFKFIGNVHGDEPVGREVLMHLANWLCNNYLKDPLATLIVENMHLHILPTMNPDGFALRWRGNANNIDLNRDFPDQFFSVNNDINYRQPETRAIMNWVKQEHFTASASLHGGALVANYPWDGTRDTGWDNVVVAITISGSNQYNFVSGVHGRIFAADTGRPVPGSVMIKGIDSKVRASRTFGDYHRIIVPGEKYEVMASMEGFRPKSTRIVLEQEAVNLDFILDPDGADGQLKLHSDYGCHCGNTMMFHVQEAHIWLYLLVLCVLLTLYLVFKRKTASRLLAYRYSPRRPVAV
ncbi:carboxypeptidase SOL1-like [Panicum virgatum]|nr:carboxypeptidase SOL1-like [Panicum virgatum]